MNCPFINSNNPHCNEHLNIQTLDDAFELCADRYMLCPVYLQLSRSCRDPVAAAAAPVSYTERT